MEVSDMWPTSFTPSARIPGSLKTALEEEVPLTDANRKLLIDYIYDEATKYTM